MQGGTTHCPNFVKRDMSRCVTIDDSYYPSAFQQREYCKGARHRICPFYVGYQKKQASMEPEPALVAGK